jgi:probable rRNA maturation factor
MPILFFSEGTDFRLDKPLKSISWIKKAIKIEKSTLVSLNYIFCSDQYLVKLNKQYLGHNTLTDILTFDLAEEIGSVKGEIYISVERVLENARVFGEPFDRELHRVMIHGVLHLMGLDDKKAADQALMREKEEAYLSLR